MTATISERDILRRIRDVLPAAEQTVALHEPRFFGNEKRYLDDCIDTGWVSYAGSYVERFERALAETCGVRHAIAVTSGTVALEVALRAAGLAPGEEVIVPALTFVATANAVVHAGGIPHFVDCDESSLGISAQALSSHLSMIAERREGRARNRLSGRAIAVLMPVHIFGHPADMDALNTVARDYGLAVVEDATEALGSRYKGRSCGALAALATLSFNGNKIVTTGGGGAVLTDDDGQAAAIRHRTTTAKLKHRWAFNHDEIGWNFRLPNINAALGLAQLERLPEMVAAKDRLYRRYAERFADCQGLRVFADAPFARSNHWLVSAILDIGQEAALEPILGATNDAGVATRPIWTPLHQLPMYRDNPRSPLPMTESLAQRILSLPSSPFLAPR